MPNESNRPSASRPPNVRRGGAQDGTAAGVNSKVASDPTVTALGRGVWALCAATFAAALTLLLVAGVETLRLAPDAGGVSAFVACVGLLAPLALAIGLGVGVFALLTRVPLGGFWSGLGLLDSEPPEVVRLSVARSLLLGLAFAIWLLLAAAIGVAALESGGSVAPFALAMVLALCLCLGVAWRVAPMLSRRLTAKRARPWVVCVLLAVVLWIWALARIGTPSGAGGTFALFGVLRREELDLTAPFAVLALVAAAYQLPALLRRVPSWALGLGAAAVLSCFGFAGRLLDEPNLALAVERKGALTALSLKGMRVASDRDDDGFAAGFGGGDCNDADGRINPTADEIAGNGIDEDCSGGDDTALPVASNTALPRDAAAQATATGTQATAAPGLSLPKDLNVVFITVDTLRYDISFVGYPRKITPNIDALAAKATYFDHAYALASYTSKSMGPLLVGRYGSETHHGELHFSIYPPIDKMLQERLGAAGIRTLSIQAHWYFKPNTGLGRGFDVLDMSAAPAEKQGEGDRSVSSDRISDAALKHLAELQTKPDRFFMWVHYLDPHAEYVRHDGFDFGNETRDLYDSEVAFTDHHVGRVIDAIQNGPLGSRTAIIVTSDHGESFGEHGMTRHGFELWDVLVRVPLLIYLPGAQPGLVKQRRSAIDLAPTILELYGIPRPGPGEKDFLSGTSLLQDVLRPDGYEPAARPIFIDMPGGPFVPERQAYIENDLKIITSKLRPMGLYDLAKDPDENQNLMKDTKASVAHLERMKAFRKQLRRAD